MPCLPSPTDVKPREEVWPVDYWRILNNNINIKPVIEPEISLIVCIMIIPSLEPTLRFCRLSTTNFKPLQQHIHSHRRSNMAQVYKPTSDSPLLRLMVLETDKPHPDTESERGSFGQILHHHFSNAGEAHHPPLAIETSQVFVVTEQGGRMPAKEEFEGYHGLLITGSMYDAHGDNEWILDLLKLLKGTQQPFQPQYFHLL